MGAEETNIPKRTNTVFYSDIERSIIDFVMDNGKSEYYGLDLAAMKSRYPDVEIVKFDEAIERKENHFKHAPERITREKFIEMLEVLPPLHWRSSGDSESFKLSEFTTGSITEIFCRIGHEYWKLKDHFKLSHEIIVDRCKLSA